MKGWYWRRVNEEEWPGSLRKSSVVFVREKGRLHYSFHGIVRIDPVQTCVECCQSPSSSLSGTVSRVCARRSRRLLYNSSRKRSRSSDCTFQSIQKPRHQRKGVSFRILKTKNVKGVYLSNHLKPQDRPALPCSLLQKEKKENPESRRCSRLLVPPLPKNLT
jgi:hypothetical protein